LEVRDEVYVVPRAFAKMNTPLQKLAEDVDRLITLDINRRGVIEVLYQAAREKIGRPLVLAAAEALAKAVSPGCVVLIEKTLQSAMKAAARGAGFAVLTPDQAVAAYRSPAPLHAAAVLSKR